MTMLPSAMSVHAGGFLVESRGWQRGKDGGEARERRGEEKGVRRDPVWRWCQYWPSVNGKFTDPFELQPSHTCGNNVTRRVVVRLK